MRKPLAALFTAVALLLLAPAAASAHQPWFEDEDFTAAAPFAVADPSVSTAVYATLADRTDVDYYAFSGQAGDSVLLEITIPRIAGQESFTPTLALLGPGLPRVALPAAITRPRGAGAQIARATGEPTIFNEPFSGTSYWERQSVRVALPQDGDFVVAVWSESGQTGRYTFVIGDREIPGGDRQFRTKIADYWTPVPPPALPAAPAAQPGADHHCGR